MSDCILLLVPLCRRTYLTILEGTWSANFKMVYYVLLRPLRPELEGQDPFGMNTKKGQFLSHDSDS
jgi:hypothetical protein